MLDTNAVVAREVLLSPLVFVVAKAEPVWVTLNGAEEGVALPAYIAILSDCGAETSPTVLAAVPAVNALADSVHPAIVPNVDVREAVVILPEIFTFDAVRVPEKVADAAFRIPVRVGLLDKTTLLVPVEDVTPVPPLATERVPDVMPPAFIDAVTLELADTVAEDTVPLTRLPAIDDAVLACTARTALEDIVADATEESVLFCHTEAEEL